MAKSSFFMIALVFPLTLWAQSDAEIVTRLTKIGEIAEAKLKSIEPEVSPPTSLHPTEWWRRKVTVEKLSIDARRTDSLVSPYVGELRFECRVKGAMGLSKEAATSLPDRFSVSNKCIASFAFQSSKWALKAFKCEEESGSKVSLVDIDENSSNRTKVACFSAFASE